MTELTAMQSDDSIAATHYYLADQVGTTQIETSGGGWPVWQGWFTPFGQEIVNGGEQTVIGDTPADGTTNRYKFTGKERDTESGLDYFGARYYASTMGRFMSPDWSAKEDPVPYAKLDNPQTLNLYSYVRNNPLSQVDPDGHCCLLEEIDVVVKPLVDSAEGALADLGGGASVAGASRWGLLAGPAIIVGAMIHPAKVGQSDADEIAQRDANLREKEAEPQAAADGAGARKGGNGTIYRVPGSGTKSGKPYIGRHNKPNPSKTRKSKDGRDRSQAEVVDTYNASDTAEGRQKEQQQIDANGGVSNLDNKRNEIKPTPQ